MPRPNRPRSIASEQALARRIAYEREAREWSPQGLASRMTQAGCPIQASAIYKIEKNDPPRRITVDELVAFSEVFGIPVAELLLPPEAVVTEELGLRILRWDEAEQAAYRAQEEAKEAWEAIEHYVSEHPEVRDRLGDFFQKWSRHFFEDGHEFRTARYVYALTKDPEWGERAKAALDAIVEERREA